VTAYEQATATTGTATDRPVTETAKDQAGAVAGTAKSEVGNVAGAASSAASEVAGTAKEQVGQVAGEAKNQVAALTSQAKKQVSEQATMQTMKAAEGVRGIADQLQALTRGEQAEGVAADVVKDISQRVQGLASKLESTEPQELLNEVRRFARNKPGMFLIGAMAAGFVGGRLVKGATADDDSQQPDYSQYRTPQAQPLYTPATTYTPEYAATTDYSDTPDYSGTTGYTGTAAGAPLSGLESPTTGTGYPSSYGAETYPDEPRPGTGLGGAI